MRDDNVGGSIGRPCGRRLDKSAVLSLCRHVHYSTLRDKLEHERKNKQMASAREITAGNEADVQ
jgi:hypothetical protein